MTEQVEELTRGEALARVAVLEAENAALRKRAYVPDGWRVFAPTSTTLRPGERWEVYGPNGGGIVNADDVKDWVVRGLLDAIAAPAPVERNQCDGCQAGIPVENGMHRMGKPGGYPDLMACTADRYAPVERVEQVAGGITWRADGDANFYSLMRDGNWLARVQFNGELLVAEHERILASFVSEPAAQDVAGLELAAKYVEQRAEDYDRDHGLTEPDTGHRTYPGDGAEYMEELDNIAAGIRALAHQSGGAR